MEKDFIASELIGEGVAYTIMGICVVFLILIIIMFVIKAMALFSVEKKEKEPAAAQPVVLPSEPVDEQLPETDDSELIAVITAAIAASLGKSASSVRIRSYKKVCAWNKAGRREILENRF